MSKENQSTNFELVGKFHEFYDHDKPHDIQINALTEKPKLVDFRFGLIMSEIDELKDAIAKKNMIEVIDGLGDVAYTVYGMAQALGINLDQAFKIIHESNMTKACETELEAIETIEEYNMKPNFENISVKYRMSTDGKYYIIYNADTGKILKSKNFIEPDFTPLHPLLTKN